MLTRAAVYVSTVIVLTGCASQMRLGEGASPVRGSAGAAGTRGAGLPQCSAPIGVAALVEPDAQVATLLSRIGLDSPLPLMRLMMQQSNCFQVVDRGAAMSNMQQEARFEQDGMLRSGSQTARGRLVAAEYFITPQIVFSEPNAGGGGVALGLGSRLGIVGAIAGAFVGSMRVQEAQVVLFVTDAASGIQVAAVEGSAKVRDFGGAGGLGAIGSGLIGFGAIGGYSKTNEGKLIAAALLDSFNEMVPHMQAMTAKASASAAEAPAAPAPATPVPAPAPSGAGVPAFAAGASYTPAVAINVRAGPGTTAAVVGRAAPGSVLTASGERRNDWWHVRSATTEGWVMARNLRSHNE